MIRTLIETNSTENSSQFLFFEDDDDACASSLSEYSLVSAFIIRLFKHDGGPTIKSQDEINLFDTVSNSPRTLSVRFNLFRATQKFTTASIILFVFFRTSSARLYNIRRTRELLFLLRLRRFLKKKKKYCRFVVIREKKSREKRWRFFTSFIFQSGFEAFCRRRRRRW